jgi:hypothetical protein
LSYPGQFLYCGLVLWRPQRQLAEEASGPSRDGFRRKGRRLVPEIILLEHVVPDSLARRVLRVEPEGRFIGNGADDHGGSAVGVPETYSGFVCGVNGLDELVCRWEICADNYVNVSLLFLRVLHLAILSVVNGHEDRIVPPAHRRVKWVGAPGGNRTRMKAFRGLRPAIGPRAPIRFLRRLA